MRVSIPANTRKFIIGAKGAKIKEIQERTETKITVPSVEEVPPQVSEDPFAEDETMIDVTIEGDPAGAAAAKAEIDSIVNARVRKSEFCYCKLPLALYSSLTES